MLQENIYILAKTLCEFFGKSREEIIGKCDEEIFPSNIVETFKETDKIVIESKVVNYMRIK